MQSAGEGGAWGIALLAAYMVRTEQTEPLADFLAQRVFADQQGATADPLPADTDGIRRYMNAYCEGLAAERAAVCNQ